MVYCRLGEESGGPITTLTSAKQKKRAEFAVELCEIVTAGNKIDCTDEERITLFIKYFKRIQVYLKLFPDIWIRQYFLP